MPISWIKQKSSFVDGTKNRTDKKESILQPGIVIVKDYILFSAFYCAPAANFSYYVVENTFLAITFLLALLIILTKYQFLLQTKKNSRKTYIILKTASVVLSLFASGRWVNTAYQRQLTNYHQTIRSYE
jgi:hypothetical protein